MKKTVLLVFSHLFVFCLSVYGEPLVLKNERIEVGVDASGNLAVLKNLQTGRNYASGHPLWRLYFDTKKEKEHEVVAAGNTPKVSGNDNSISIDYDRLQCKGKPLAMRLRLTITLENDLVRFASQIVNEESGTIVRELHYPLVGDCRIPEDHRLLTGSTGGRLTPNPKQHIRAYGNSPPYMAPSQHYRQIDVKYPAGVSTNCFVLTGDSEGLYFGSHDTTFQDTWHGLRMYPDEKGNFDLLEAGLYKYPNIVCGEKWQCDANVIAPYSGTWHRASNLYRRWVDTWWDRREPPQWVKEMKSWQRVIFRHQYGETFFRYSDLPGRIKTVGESVGADAVFPFGWWDSGMDNGNPHYTTDPEQGGDEAWKKAIADFRKDGQRVLLYFNGKLIDKESEYYNTGGGKEVCFRDNTGTEYTEQYRFKGMGTFTGYFNRRTFVVADCGNPKWQKKLLEMADLAYYFGADSVFYDQLGYGESVPNWNLSGEFPIPNLRIIADKADSLKMIREHIAKKGNKDFALGTEHFTDVTAQHVDYIHNLIGGTYAPAFLDWIRYTFPEVVLSEREIRDDTDVARRVNHGLLRGLRNDIEIYRCRDLIDKTPNYQRYLAQANALKDKYKDLLLLGTYRDTEGFTIDNPKVDARCFVNDNRMAVALTQSRSDSEKTVVSVPNGRLIESSVLGAATVEDRTVTLKRDGLVVMIFEINGPVGR